MIRVEGLTFTFPKSQQATLRDLTFSIAKGEIFGFLGPSGAGKSTTQKILIGLLKQFQGICELMGKPITAWQHDLYEHIGVSFELPNHFLKLSALENLAYFRSLYSVKTHDPLQVLAWVGLKEHAQQKVAEFSKGMKIRLNLARSLIHQPQILFLDEPTSGLDPVNARQVKELVQNLRNEGATVFLTTHDMTLADQMCDRVAFLASGKIALIGEPETLKRQYGTRELEVTLREKPDPLRFSMEKLGQNAEFMALLQGGEQIESMHSMETSLENVFIEVTGERLQ